jgi:HD-like signal output (HDOD) protein
MTAAPNSILTNRRRLLTAVPPFRPVAVQLLRLVDGPAQDLPRIVALLRSDAVMAAELMRAANSPLFGSRYEIKTPLQALVYLGLERIKALVVTTAMKGLSDATPSDLTQTCWRHNLATALICQRLSGAVNLPSESSYIGGLIHDIGRLALLAAYPEYEYVLTPGNSSPRDLLVTEQELCGLNHAQAGCWLLSQWGCPIEMQNVAAFHENPAEAPKCDRALVTLVHTSARLADLIGLPAVPSAPPCELPEIASELSEIAGAGLSLDIAEIAEWVQTRVNGIELSLL